MKICNFYEFFFLNWIIDIVVGFWTILKNLGWNLKISRIYIYILKTILLRNRMKFEIPIAVSSQ